MPNRSTDAVDLLTHDHKEVDALFKRYDKLCSAGAPGDERAALAARICAMLKVHTTIEEEIFYPAAREALRERDLLDEAEVEHASAKELIAQIEDAAPTDELYDAKVRVLGEYIRHHVKEEQQELFPQVRKTGLDLALVGAALRARKEELSHDPVAA